MLFETVAADIFAVSGDARKHAQHIAVHGGHGNAESDGCDSAGGIITDSRQIPEQPVIRRQPVVIFFAKHPGCLRDIANPGIVSEPLPQFYEAILRSLRNRPDIRQFRKEPLIICADGLHAGLLKHNLRNPHMIRRRILAPRQNARIVVVPEKQCRNGIPVCFLFPVRVNNSFIFRFPAVSHRIFP